MSAQEVEGDQKKKPDTSKDESLVTWLKSEARTSSDPLSRREMINVTFNQMFGLFHPHYKKTPADT